LGLLHSSDIVSERGLLIARVCGVETHKFSQGVAVLAVFVDTKLEILGEGFIECFKVRNEIFERKILLN
jgi:hypothetical protein